MRITGLATGLDMDKIISDSMKPYRVKIDQTKQKQEIVQIKQQLYRDVINDARGFYDKYFDVSKPDSLLLSKNWSTTTFTSSNEDAVTVKGLPGAEIDKYTVSVQQVAEKATAKVGKDSLTEDVKSITIELAGEKVTIGNITDAERKDPKLLAERINDRLSEKDIKATVKYSDIAKGFVFESDSTGAKIEDKDLPENQWKDNEIKVTLNAGKDAEGNVIEINSVTGKGQDCVATISTAMGTETYKGSKNKVVYDNVEFTFNEKTVYEDEGVSKDNPVKITGKVDVTSTKDKLVTFINDYNTMIETLNKMVTEKPNKNYQPLTEEQKKEMSETEIKLWNEKVKEGQLSRDSDLTRVVNTMKSAMSSVMGSLEKIGISPVSDYQGSKNGTLKIDEAKLEKALESNPEEVMNLFIANSKDENGNEVKGIMHKLKDTLYNEVVTITSPLIKKAGIDNSSTSSNNELTKSIEKYNKKLADMEKDFARREQALYSKYARLEVAMNKYNSQQGMLMQNAGY